uniref:HAUS6_N domain-containing protein n=1 Tax=Echinococcus granulosus TaxID=6210 RepID=A0A068WI83_ECHGR|nr:hypothetical protein EgrG_000479100 [Echinococcus granulosus]
MDKSNFEVLLVNNLKILGANFDNLKLPTDPNQIEATLGSFPKPALGKLFGFLLSRLDNKRFERSIRPLLICYNRAVDNQLKNLFFLWIKELPMDLGLSMDFSRVWSCPSPKKSARFFAVLSMYVLEKCMRIDFCVNLDVNDVVDDKVNEFLRNISFLQFKSISIDKLITAKESCSVIEDSNILFDCLNHANLPKSGGDVLHRLSFFQRNRWAELQGLKNAFSLHYSEWLAMRPLYLDMSILSSASPLIRAKDVNGSTDMTSDIDKLSSLSRLMERTGDLFSAIGNSLTRSSEVRQSLETGPSSELSWCSRSLSRIAESSKFSIQRGLTNDTQALLSRLDSILTTLSDLIAEESDLLSFSISRSFGRLSGLYVDSSVDSKTRLLSQDVPLNNSSLLSKSQASCYSAPAKSPELVSGKSDEIGEVTRKSKRPFSNEAADLTEFGTSDDLFNDINVQLASLLQTTTLSAHRNSIENESDVLSNSQAETPHIQPPLVPFRLSSRRASFKSPRLGTPMSSEQAINQKEAVLSNTHWSSHLKSFSEFSIKGTDGSSRSPRTPLTSIDMNVEGCTRLAVPLSLDSPHLNSPPDDRENQQGDGMKRENDSDPDDESLGLLNLGDMSDSASQILFSP